MSEILLTLTHKQVTGTTINEAPVILSQKSHLPASDPYTELTPREIIDITGADDGANSIVTSFKLPHLPTDATTRSQRVTETPQELVRAFQEAYGRRYVVPVNRNVFRRALEWAKHIS